MLYVGSERVKERSQYSKYSPTPLNATPFSAVLL
jgi:hypothetical protein